MTNRNPREDGTTGEARCRTPADTHALAAKLATNAGAGAVFSLEGPLGAGKTEFVKGFVAAMGYAGGVSSPTFTLLHEYAGGRATVVHFDWYRLDDADEVIGLGWDDYLDSGDVLLVEWGGKFSELLPAGTTRLRFTLMGDERIIRWERMT